MSNTLEHAFYRMGYSSLNEIPFLFYEGQFGRLDIFLDREVDWTPKLGPDFIPRVTIPFKEVFLNSSQVYPENIHLQGGIIVMN